MDNEHDELLEDGYVPVPEGFRTIGRNGYCCRGTKVWFEVDGRTI